jgi:DNA-binding cell septation regulator SpoVG
MSSSLSDDQIMVELRRIERGQLRAFADVTMPTAVGEMTIRGFRVVQKDGEQPWIGFPSTSYSKGGTQVNKPIIDVTQSVKRRLTDVILARFKAEPK